MTALLKKRWPQPKVIVKKHIRDLKVLVVDDQSSMRTIVKNMLKEMGFQSSNIDDASDGMRAVEKLKTNRYDLIVCDWIMPNLDGLQLLKIVKGVMGFKNTIFIMVTAEGQKSRVIEAIQNRVDNYVVKPFSVEQITKKLKMVISKIAFV
ncbi:MAG: response regulator [Deltaproteobacteria bacterium]|nr:response regulator [Deltaproteobacteria bacterium]